MNNSSDKPQYDLETIAIRAGFERSQFGEHSEPMYLTSSYLFDSAEDAAARFRGDVEGPVYARYTIQPSICLSRASQLSRVVRMPLQPHRGWQLFYPRAWRCCAQAMK